MTTYEIKGEYVSPACEQLTIMVEGTVLASSTAGNLGAFDDNKILDYPDIKYRFSESFVKHINNKDILNLCY